MVDMSVNSFTLGNLNDKSRPSTRVTTLTLGNLNDLSGPICVVEIAHGKRADVPKFAPYLAPTNMLTNT
ncbi:hypothetical protein Y032_0436g1431 [Ancylostoma ceylanicum]|uniref:Uncharacterized protein n=1 Tax=Ancylostoma ceylanicum TaxID=53326 RepID=A0A016WZT9_9BILA|nr:hypothetical protein Y032_0436g1431 [Ancylostoma ceylanicum]